MRIPFYLVDAFAHRPLSGNPAAVCILPYWLPDTLLHDLAVEINQAETAYAVKHADGTGYALRWFTPQIEIDLCGHATLAMAHVLFRHMKHTGKVLHFTTRFAGPLAVRQQGDWLELDFPSRPPSIGQLTSELVVALNGAQPHEVWFTARDYMLVFESAVAVAAVDPDFELLKKLDKWVCITAAGEGEVDFVSRFFTPGDGRNEDPVTGSAHAMLAPFWAKRLGKSSLHAQQISERGGTLKCQLQDDRVLISGQACTLIEGVLELPDI